MWLAKVEVAIVLVKEMSSLLSLVWMPFSVEVDSYLKILDLSVGKERVLFRHWLVIMTLIFAVGVRVFAHLVKAHSKRA